MKKLFLSEPFDSKDTERNQIGRVMKLTTCSLLLCSCFAFAGNVKSQNAKVNLSKHQVQLEEILDEIEKQTDYLFVSNRDIDLKQKVSVHVKNQSVRETLASVLKNTGLTFTVEGVNIILSRVSGNDIVEDSQQQEKTVTGRVVDIQGEPIIGVNIIEKGTTNGAITDLEGNFSLRVKEGAILQISYVGYLNQEIKVGKLLDFSIVLKEDVQTLDELVVVGYGTQKKGNLTGSVASVKTEELTVAPVASSINSLAGRLPGLVSQQLSGQPGADQASVRIRGFSDNAIWIVDGIEADFNSIDPNQIESISILKDGSASIYGARAGNGVILVTTKRGSIQKPTITINSSISFQGITTMPKPVSAGDYAMLKREEWLQAGNPESTAPFTEEQIQKFYAGNDPQYPNTDWYKELIRNWAPQNQHNISVRGGSEKIKYYGFLGYMGQESMWKKNGGDYKRINLQSNIDANITDNLSIQFDIALMKSDNMTTRRGQQAGINTVWQDFWNTLPIYPATLPDPARVSYADGKGTGGAHVTSNTELGGYMKDEKFNARATISLKYDFDKWLEGLSAKVFVNYYDDALYRKRFTRPTAFYRYDVESDTYINSGALGTAAQMNQHNEHNTMLTRQFSLNYNRTFVKDHALQVLALYEAIDYKGNWLSASRDDFLTPSLEEIFVGSAATMKNDGASSEMGRMSFVGKINYTFRNKYLLETTLRADASAKFAPGHRWGIFPNVSLGWRISEEYFMDNAKHVLDDLKLRASYGRSGNDAVGNFQYLSGYKVDGYYLLGNKTTSGIVSTGLANPSLTWEKFDIWNVGMDYSFNNRLIYGEADVFYRNRSGIPGTRMASVSPTFGASFPVENINSMTDRGFEISVGSSKKFKDFSFDIRGNISWSRAKWDHFEEQDYKDPDQIRLNKQSGHWTDRAFGYVSDGLFTSQEEIDNLPFDQDNQNNASLRPGDIRYVDINKDKVLDWKDQVEIGKGTVPHWMYGFNLNFTYKDFDLAALFQGAFGYNTMVSLYHGTLNYPQEVFDMRWTQSNNNANALYPRLGGAATNSYVSDYFYKKAGYLRLKSLAIGYTLPKEICRMLFLQHCRVYFAGVNLFTINKLGKYHIDPEAPSGNAGFYYPQQRTLSVGINVSF